MPTGPATEEGAIPYRQSAGDIGRRRQTRHGTPGSIQTGDCLTETVEHLAIDRGMQATKGVGGEERVRDRQVPGPVGRALDGSYILSRLAKQGTM